MTVLTLDYALVCQKSAGLANEDGFTAKKRRNGIVCRQFFPVGRQAG